MRAEDTTADELAAIDKAIGVVVKRQAALVRVITRLEDEDATEPLEVELAALARQKREHEAQHAEALARRAAWEESEAALNNIIATITELREGILGEGTEATLDAGERILLRPRDLGYDERRNILRLFGVTVAIFPRNSGMKPPHRFSTNLTEMAGERDDVGILLPSTRWSSRCPPRAAPTASSSCAS